MSVITICEECGKDGNKRNNDPSNLALMTQSEHCKIHFQKGGDYHAKVIPISTRCVE